MGNDAMTAEYTRQLDEINRRIQAAYDEMPAGRYAGGERMQYIKRIKLLERLRDNLLYALAEMRCAKW